MKEHSMPINPTTNIDLTAIYQSKPQPEHNEVHQSGHDLTTDNDKDDQQPTKPTINTSGQTIGTIINTKA
jgi:hypothetical protein